MDDLSLEKEFEIYKQIHKTSIVTAKMANYYRDLNNSGVKIPDFMQDDPVRYAEKQVVEMIGVNPNKFEEMYNKAWNEYSTILP